METSRYVTDLDPHSNELGLGPMVTSEEPIESENNKKVNWWEKIDKALLVVNKGAETVDKVLNTGKKSTGVPLTPQVQQPAQSGIDFKTVGWLLAGAGAIFGLMKLSTPKKNK